MSFINLLRLFVKYALLIRCIRRISFPLDRWFMRCRANHRTDIAVSFKRPFAIMRTCDALQFCLSCHWLFCYLRIYCSRSPMVFSSILHLHVTRSAGPIFEMRDMTCHYPLCRNDVSATSAWSVCVYFNCYVLDSATAFRFWQFTQSSIAISEYFLIIPCK